MAVIGMVVTDDYIFWLPVLSSILESQVEIESDYSMR